MVPCPNDCCDWRLNGWTACIAANSVRSSGRFFRLDIHCSSYAKRIYDIAGRTLEHVESNACYRGRSRIGHTQKDSIHRTGRHPSTYSGLGKRTHAQIDETTVKKWP